MNNIIKMDLVIGDLTEFNKIEVPHTNNDFATIMFSDNTIKKMNISEIPESDFLNIISIYAYQYKITSNESCNIWKCNNLQILIVNIGELKTIKFIRIHKLNDSVFPKEIANLIHLRKFSLVHNEFSLSCNNNMNLWCSYVKNDDKIIIFGNSDLIIDSTIKFINIKIGYNIRWFVDLIT